MTLPPLFADVSAATVLPIVHWVGIGFVFLWFLGSCMKDGMWDNGLRCLSALVASMLSFPIALLVAGMAGGEATPAPDDYTPMFVTIGANWISFLVCLGLVLTITDKLSQVKVAFHPVVNSVGSFVFICGITGIFLFYTMPIFSIVKQLNK